MQEPNSEWQEPPLPEKIVAEGAEMSEVATLGNIFFEPGRTFEDLRRKPRFILALLICALMIGAYGFALQTKLGEGRVRSFIAEQIDKSPQGASMAKEDKEKAIDMQLSFNKIGQYISPIFIIIFFFIGGLLYWGGAKAFGGSGGFLHGLSTYVYSSLPPTVISMLANFIVLFFKSPDEIDLALSQRGVIHANPSMLMDGKAMPVLTTLVSLIDLFAIWGWILAAIGLQKTNKISSGSAWAVTIIIALIGITIRVLLALLSGNPS